jgi:proline iminopeptidase
MRVEVNGTDLYVDVEGPQLTVRNDRLVERPTIVALHGGPGFDQGYLRPGLAALTADAQLLYVDLRGQGRSGRPPVKTCTLEQMADDVEALCDRLGVVRPVVLGHSAGGFVALHLALRHPGRVGGLVLCDTAATMAPVQDDDPPPGLAERAPAEAVEIAARLFGGDFSPGTVAQFGQSVAPFYAGPSHGDVPGPLFALTGFAAEVADHFFSALAPRYDLRARLPEIGAPAVVVTGRHDWVCPPVAGRTIAAGLPDAEYLEIAGAGHFPFAEEPEAFRTAVRALLERVAVREGRATAA